MIQISCSFNVETSQGVKCRPSDLPPPALGHMTALGTPITEQGPAKLARDHCLQPSALTGTPPVHHGCPKDVSKEKAPQ